MVDALSPCPCWAKSVSDKLIGNLIYKDECTKCFNTPKSQDGLDVCLSCFNGSCSTNGHTQSHYALTQHPIVMNIKMVKKNLPPGELKEITKLAIGIEGGADADAGRYDTFTSVRCLACEKELDKTIPQVASMVDSILLAQSAYMAESVQEWEEEFKTCPHTDKLDQSGAQKIAAKNLAHCSQCDLKSNLWLCMTCGSLGCGRKQYDGTGGNGHGVEHFEKTGHAVSCKLGTITAQGKADLHCYACGDEVLDNKLGEHLDKLGISMGEQVKTEKSLTEINLQANLALNLSKILEAGVELTPVFGPKFTGMENLGNSCYMNSVVQVLFAIPEFVDHYLPNAADHLQNCPNKAPTCYQCQFSKVAHGLYSGDYSQKKLAEKVHYEGITEEELKKEEYYQDGIRPQIFKTLVAGENKDFKGGQQQDAAEYYHHIMEHINRNENKIKSNVDLQSLFEYQAQRRVQCNKCKGVKYNTEKDSELILRAPVDSSIEKGTPVDLNACLESYFADSIVDDFNCPVCQERTTVTVTKRFITYPKQLTVVLKREVYDGWVPKKLEYELKFAQDEPLDLEKYRKVEAPEGEIQLPEDAPVEQEPELNQELLNMLIGMGLPETPAKHALHNTGNNNADMAVMWYYENMDKPEIQQPLVVKKAAPANDGPQINPESVMMITSMGVDEKKATKALKKCDGNVERALDWVFSHMDDPDSDDEMQVDQESQVEKKEFKDENPGVYKLNSFITHLGSSVHAGHYVCHIKKDGKWIYFNDAKVAETNDAPFGKGYVYFFRKQ